MRKFGIEKMSSSTDDYWGAGPALHLTMEQEDGVVVDLGYSRLIDENNEDYFGIERQLVEVFNEKLIEANLPKMTSDEARSAFTVKPQRVYTPEQLQRLAGFTVEKKIIYHNDLEEAE